MYTLKLTAIGNSVGVILPKEALEKLRLGKGDQLFLTDSPEGFRVTAYDPEFERQMVVARQIMKEDRDLLRKLAE